MKARTMVLAVAAIFMMNACARQVDKPTSQPVQVSAPPKATSVLPDQASAEDVWGRALELLKVPHGLVTKEDVDESIGGHLVYLNQDQTGYMAGVENFRSKNYVISLVYLYQPLDRRVLVGPQSTLSMHFPACLAVDRAEQDVLHHGMHFVAEDHLPASPGRTYDYPDDNGSIEILFYVPPHRYSASDHVNVCVTSVVIRGFVKAAQHGDTKWGAYLQAH